MGDEIRITVIATGFERAGIPRRMIERPITGNINRISSERSSERSESSEHQRPVAASVPVQSRPVENVTVNAQPVVQTPPPAPKPEFKPQTNYQEDLDIPTFLRNRR
jgi:hypothetical protein